MCNKLCNWGNFYSGRLRWSGRLFALDGRTTLDTPRASRFWTLGALWTVAVLWTVGLLWTLLLISIPRDVKNLDGRILLGIGEQACNTLLAVHLSNAVLTPLGHLEQFGSCTRLSNVASWLFWCLWPPAQQRSWVDWISISSWLLKLKDETEPSFNQVPLFVSHMLTSDSLS